MNSIADVSARPTPITVRVLIKTLVDLFKVRIGALMAVTAVVGYVIAAPVLSSSDMCWVALCVLLGSAAAGAFNQYAEVDLDAKMARTQHRAFVAGVLVRDSRWLWAIALMVAGACALAAWRFDVATAAYLFLGAFTYGVIYTLWLKRRTAWNIVIGGAAGSFAVLAGAAAGGAVTPEAAWLSVALFLWTPPHFWSLAIATREQYAAAGVPMLPVVVGDAKAARVVLLSAILLVASTLPPAFYSLGWIYLAGALSGGAYFIWRSVLLWRTPTKKAAIQCFVSSLVQLSSLLIAAVVDVLLRS